MISFAGEALEPQNLKQWVDLAGDENPKIVNMYGITETTVHAMYRRIFKQDLLSHSSMIGEPFPDLRIYILDERMEPVPYGVQGEIYVGGDGVGIGYHNRKDLNEQRFITDPFKREANGRLYRSGI
ncbi:AMP-binding protein [Ochrobactrum grignonense]|nr:AMP-binding protein [Brucella grignonensis]